MEHYVPQFYLRGFVGAKSQYSSYPGRRRSPFGPDQVSNRRYGYLKRPIRL
jgi:hypothetical protein